MLVPGFLGFMYPPPRMVLGNLGPILGFPRMIPGFLRFMYPVPGIIPGFLGMVLGCLGSVLGNLGLIPGNLGSIPGFPRMVLRFLTSIPGFPWPNPSSQGSFRGTPEPVLTGPGTVLHYGGSGESDLRHIRRSEHLTSTGAILPIYFGKPICAVRSQHFCGGG